MSITSAKQIFLRLGLTVLLGVIFHILFSDSLLHAGAPQDENEEGSTYYDELLEKLKQGKSGKLGTPYYWDEGLHVVSPKKNFILKIGGHMGVDLGYVDRSGDIREDFSSLDGFSPDFRRLQITASGTLYQAVDFKVEMDFANVRTIKDNWLRYKKNPFLSQFRLGHMKEPFSIERLTPSSCITFMERALPVNAFSLGRNIGLQFNDTAFDDQVTLAGGFFWNTGSLHAVSDPQDSISEANGYNITARVTGLGRYADKGMNLLHLGLSFSLGKRDSNDKQDRLSSLPESYIADQTLVDTDEFSADRIYRINPELAAVSGPFSFQSEFTYYNAESDEGEAPDLWGHYLYVSYFITGEHRAYDRSKGIFSAVYPKQNFNFRQKRWGAWELGFRISYIDLNDEAIKGGKERNFTLGLNGYLNPNMRIMCNFVRVHVEDRDNSRVVDDGSANIFQMRFQIQY